MPVITINKNNHFSFPVSIGTESVLFTMGCLLFHGLYKISKIPKSQEDNLNKIETFCVHQKNTWDM